MPIARSRCRRRPTRRRRNRRFIAGSSSRARTARGCEGHFVADCARHAGAAVQKHIITASIVAVAGDIDWSAKLERNVNRRSLLKSAVLALAAQRLPLPSWLTAAQAQDGNQDRKWRHGLSLFGDLKYPPAFKQFDYVNASAPKRGTVREIAIGTFDKFNTAAADVKGNYAGGVGLIYDTLLTSSLDEVSTGYGLLAESVSYPDDYSSASYRLRAEAKWHDGTPVTPDDVIFSFTAFK